MDADSVKLYDFVRQPRLTRQRALSSASLKEKSTPRMSATAFGTDDVDMIGDEEEDEEDDSPSVYEGSPSPFLPPGESPGKVGAASMSGSTGAGSGGASGGAKRGRKPAPAASRNAREIARKTNHSRIEKRRREKMNEALATLREIVPANIVVPTQALEASPDLVAAGKTKKKSSDKEFKLEVLERTVVFIRHLTQRVGELEQELMTRSHSPTPRDKHSPPTDEHPVDGSSKKRRRMQDEHTSSSTIDIPATQVVRRPTIDNLITSPHEPTSPISTIPFYPATSVPNRPSLPSIATMLNNHQLLSPPYSDAPNYQPPPLTCSSSNETTNVTTSVAAKYAPALTLPSPAYEATAVVRNQFPSPSADASTGVNQNSLSIPSPRSSSFPILELPTPFALGNGIRLDNGNIQRATGQSAKEWTHDEETAASLLVQISGDRTPMLGPWSPGTNDQVSGASRVPQTPGSILGL